MIDDIISIVRDVSNIAAGTASQANADNGGRNYNVGKAANDASMLLSLKHRAMSISEQARKSIMVYPVLISSSIGDTKIAQNITKYLEIQYAVFTLLAVGINHDMTSTNVREQIMKISAENFKDTSLSTDSDFAKCALEAFTPYRFNEYTRVGPRIGANMKSIEGVIQEVTEQDVIDQAFDSIDNDNNLTTAEKVLAKTTLKKIINDREKEYESINKEKENVKKSASEVQKDRDALEEEKEEWKEIRNGRRIPEYNNPIPPPGPAPIDPNKYNGKKYTGNPKVDSKIDYYSQVAKYILNDAANNSYDKLAGSQRDVESKGQMTAQAFEKAISGLKAEPTIIKLDFDLGDNKISIPIAIKAAMHPIGSTEMRMLIESGIEGKMPSIRVAKALSGEISMVKDLIFQMDKAERDQKLYKILGRHPWFQRLQERKMKSHFNIFHKAVSGVGNVLPTSSLIVTKNDLTLSTRIPYTTFLKNEKLMKGILDSMYLLSIGVYEPELEQISFFFSGFSDPFIFSMSEISKGGVDANQMLLESLNNLSRKV